jgi:murein L,D-transpeptidase YcbB/YkuD
VTVTRDAAYSDQLLKRKPGESVSELVTRLEGKDPDYLVLKNFLRDSITVQDTLKHKAVVLAMNYRRYLAANHQPEYLVVNIPEAEAYYYRNDKLLINMRTVVGKKKTPTPTIASYITSIVTFPYWNVPHSIAVNELLPKAQKNDNYLEQNNFEVVDAKGNIIEDSELDLKEYNTKDFPYYFRQSTGAENDLGVIKFNLQNPFSIFLHSTSSTSSFTRDLRFLSHGCIRLEKPFELADALLRGKIDIAELKRGKKNTEPETLKLILKIPVFIIYVPVKVESGKVTFLRDVYGLIQ